LVDELFDAFDAHLKAQGWLAMGGQMIDASIVPVPKQRNTRDENAAIKAGETPEGWDDKPVKSRQKDTDARWTRKHGKLFRDIALDGSATSQMTSWGKRSSGVARP